MQAVAAAWDLAGMGGRVLRILTGRDSLPGQRHPGRRRALAQLKGLLSRPDQAQGFLRVHQFSAAP